MLPILGSFRVRTLNHCLFKKYAFRLICIRHHCNETKGNITSKNSSENPDTIKLTMESILLRNIAHQIKTEWGIDLQLKYTSNEFGCLWQTWASLVWPVPLRTYGAHASKVESENLAAQIALENLMKKNIISNDHQLCINSNTELPSIRHPTPHSKVIKENRDEARSIIRFVKEVKEGRTNHIKSPQLSLLNRSEFVSDSILKSAKSSRRTRKLATSIIEAPTVGMCHQISLRHYSQCNSNVLDQKTTDVTEEWNSGTNWHNIPNSDLEMVASQFPQPKGTLHNCYTLVAKEFACQSYELKPSFELSKIVGSNTEWKCTYKLKWPEDITFSALGPTKALASRQSALITLHWLQSHGVITKAGNPIFNQKHGVEELKITVNQELSHNNRQVQLINKFTEQTLDDKTCRESSDNLLTSDESVEELQATASQFPHPKGVLHNCYASVVQELKCSSYKLKPSYQLAKIADGRTDWKCTFQIKWPEEKSFSAVMRNKALAGRQAALKVLHWLQTQGKITKTGAPIIYESAQVEQSRIPVDISIDQSSTKDIETLLQLYKKDIEPILSERADKETEVDEAMDIDLSESSDELMDTSNLDGIVRKNTKSYARRNEELYRRYVQRREEDSYLSTSIKPNDFKKDQELPIANVRSQIVELVESNRVVIVKGEPGCGKSTQVPQYVFDDWTKRMRGTECNMIITQPRRISAISLAERVAQERQERVGDVVGYQVRFKKVVPRAEWGSVVFCSTGILLRRLQNNLGLVGLSHVILDEAHERDINTDMLMVLLRRALELNPQLRIVVMSATINAELFNHHFDSAPVFHVSGFTHPVKSYYAEDLKEVNLNQKSLLRDDPNPIIDCKEVVKMIHWIDKNKPPGAILCFLPGWSEIRTSLNLLNETMKNGKHIVLPLHSRLSYSDQRQIFNVPPSGVRKVILATNIAETSITIDDVVYVVDTGAHKEERYDLERSMPSLDTQWVSRASVKQRRGRAGRVKPGESFHLFTRTRHDSMDEFPIPEIMRVPLEKTVLDCKTFNPDEKAADFLSEMPEPPSSQAVDQAVQDLVALGALNEEEKLTPLGKRIAHFSIHPKLSKTLVHAAAFRCVAPIMTIATVLSSDVEIFQGVLTDKSHIRDSKNRFHPLSDHLAVAWLYQHWEMIKVDDIYGARDFCSKMNISMQNLELVYRLRQLYSEYLTQSHLLNNAGDFGKLDSNCNTYAENDELLKAVLLSGLDNLLVRHSWKYQDGRHKKSNVVITECGQRATIHPKSVNFKRTDYPSPFLTGFRQVRSQERGSVLLHDTTLMSPLAVLLFASGHLQMHKYKGSSPNAGTWDNHVVLNFKNRRGIVMLCEESLARLLIELRIVIWIMVDYFVAVEGYPQDSYYTRLIDFQGQLLKLLSALLYKAGADIDYKDGKLRR